MKRAIITLSIILGTTIWLQAQTQTVICRYDDAGNRILRKVEGKKSTEANTSINTDSLQAKIPDAPILGIQVYPNPSSEVVYIEFTKLPDTQAEYILYDMNGRLLEQRNISTSLTAISLQNKGKGTYLLLIKAKEVNEKFKIIKQ
jgi:hypothetical protein